MNSWQILLSHLVSFLLEFWFLSFSVQKLFHLMQLCFFLHGDYFQSCQSHFRKDLVCVYVFPMLSFSSFRVLDLAFSPWSILNWFLFRVRDKDQYLFSHVCKSIFLSIISWVTIFSLIYVWYTCTSIAWLWMFKYIFGYSIIFSFFILIIQSFVVN